MSELPDLPPAPRWTVAPHPAGAAGAVRSGRRRRGLLAGSAASLLVLVGTLAVVLPQGGSRDGDTLFAGSPTTDPAPSDAPVLVAASSVEVCASPEDCRTVEGDAALHLSRALSSARPVPDDALTCLALGPTYRVRLMAPGATTQELVVRTICGPTSIGDEDFVLDPAVAARVGKAHQTGVVDPPVVGRDVAEVRLCRGDQPGEAGCTVIGAREELHLFSDLVSAGGRVEAPAGECTGVQQVVVSAFVRFADGSTTTLSAGTECGPLATEYGDHALVAPARERWFTLPTPGTPVGEAPSGASEGPTDPSQARCEWRDVTSSAYGGPSPARDVARPPTAAPRSDRTVVLVTNRGEIRLALDGRSAPCSAANLAWLGEQGYYDDTPCHRVTTKGIFVVQCGDPSGTGSGHPGYAFDDESLDGATYPRGTLAMANSGPDTNGSQFFLVWEDTQLPPNYTVFGRVLSGLTVLEEVARGGTVDGGSDGRPRLALTITDVREG
jgi:peptidyl-prolyl cis-trans isomerase B (cyclophilin B)